MPLLLMGSDTVYARKGYLAYVRASKNLLPNDPRLWQRTLYLFIRSASRDHRIEEIVTASITANNPYYVISPRELAQILSAGEMADLYQPSIPSSILRKISDHYRIAGVGVLTLKEYDHIDRLTWAASFFSYWQEGGNPQEIKFYGSAFAETIPFASYLSWLIILFGIPVSWIYRQLARCSLGNPSPLWLSLVISIASIGILILAMFLLGKIPTDEYLLLCSPKGILLVASIVGLFAIAPTAISILTIWRLPKIRAILNREDTNAAILFGTLVAAVAVFGQLAWIRFGFSLTLIIQILCATLVVTILSFVVGFAYVCFTVRQHRQALVAAPMGTLIAIVFFAVLLRWNIKESVGAAVASIPIGFAAYACTRKKSRVGVHAIASKSDNPTTADDFRNALANPSFVATPFIQARFEELLALVTSNDNSACTPIVAFVEGEPGSGKTRFVNEIVKAATAQYAKLNITLHTLSGRCVHRDAELYSRPYHPFSEALGDYVGVNRFASPTENITKLLGVLDFTGVKSYLDKVGLGMFKALLAAPIEGEISKTTTEREMASIVVSVIEGLASGAKVLWIFDDVHLIDDDSFRLLKAVFQLLRGKTAANKVIFLFTSHPEVNNRTRSLVEELGRKGDVRLFIDDKTLQAAEKTGELVGAMLESLGVDPKAQKLVLGRLADAGVSRPAFVLEIMKLLLEKDWIRNINERWRLTKKVKINEVPLSKDLEQVLLHQWSDLDKNVLDILECCAISGLVFRPAIIAETFKMDVLQMLDFLKIAEEKRLVRDTLTCDETYEFTDKRIAYGLQKLAMPTTDEGAIPLRIREYRKRLLRLMEHDLRERFQDIRNAPYAEVVVLAKMAHRMASSFPGKAFEFNWIAAEMSVAMGMLHRAVEQYDVAKSVIQTGYTPDRVSDIVSFYISYTKCLLDAEMHPDIRQYNLDELQALVVPLNVDKNIQDEITLLHSLHLYRVHNYTNAFSLAQTVATHPGASICHQARARLYAAVSMPRCTPEEKDMIIKALTELISWIDVVRIRETTTAAVSLELQALKSEAANALGYAYIHSERDFEIASTCFQLALDTKQEHQPSDKKGIAIAYGGLGDCYFYQNKIDKALDCYQKNYEISMSLGDTQGVCRMASMLGQTELLKARASTQYADRKLHLSDSVRWYERSLDAAEEHNPSGVVFALAGLLQVSIESETLSEARDVLDQLSAAIPLAVTSNVQISTDALDALRLAVESFSKKFPDLSDSIKSIYADMNHQLSCDTVKK